MSLLSNLANFATNIIGGVVSSSTGGLSNVISSTLSGAAPLMNTTAAQIAMSGLTGAQSSAAAIASANNTSNSSGTTTNAQGKIVQLNKLTGLAKFFCYYNMDSEGRIELDNGAPKLNISKVIVHASVVGIVIFAIVKVGKKKRWF